MKTAILVGLLVAAALAVPAASALALEASPSSGDSQVACPPGTPWPMTVVCTTLHDICDKTGWCESLTE
jgi:hypothetical protein